MHAGCQETDVVCPVFPPVEYEGPQPLCARDPGTDENHPEVSGGHRGVSRQQRVSFLFQRYCLSWIKRFPSSETGSEHPLDSQSGGGANPLFLKAPKVDTAARILNMANRTDLSDAAESKVPVAPLLGKRRVLPLSRQSLKMLISPVRECDPCAPSKFSDDKKSQPGSKGSTVRTSGTI